MIFQRLKNLWEISAYKVKQDVASPNVVLSKNITTVQKKMATIVQQNDNELDAFLPEQ